MSKISEIISKKVISLYDAKCVGTILNVIFDDNLKKIYGFIILDSDDDKKYKLFYKDVLNILYGECIIKNNTVLEDIILDDYNSNPINKECFSIMGEYYGRVVDVEFIDNTIQNLILDCGKKINIKDILTNNEIIIINTEEKIIKKSTLVPKRKKIYNTDKIIVKIQEEQIPKKNEVQVIPPRFVAKSLIGKIAINTIIGLNNEIIIKKGELITNKVLEKARLHNVLNKL